MKIQKVEFRNFRSFTSVDLDGKHVGAFERRRPQALSFQQPTDG